MGDREREEQGKLPEHRQPSDYSDVQPKSYDPDFISQISSKMQVPDRIAVGSDSENGFVSPEMQAATQFVGMTVPDRIVLAVEDGDSYSNTACGGCESNSTLMDESYPQYPDMNIPYTLVVGDVRNQSDNQHIGMRQGLPLHLPAHVDNSPESLSYVGLITPPRTLTLEERFPIVEDEDKKMMAAQGMGPNQGHMTANGHVGGPVPYVPGNSLHDSVLLNEEDEATLLRTQVAKLTRRVQVIEQDNQKRAGRELVMYPLILGYFLWKILGWFTRDR